MPVRPLTIDTGVAGRTQIVEPGNRFNGLTFLVVSAGVQLYVRLGNNPRIGPITSALSITFGPETDERDVSEGVDLEIDTPIAGGVVQGWTSYRPIGPTVGGGGVSAYGV